MEERRMAKAPLIVVKGVPDEEIAIGAEVKTKQALIHAHRVRSGKVPDAPLKEVLRRQQMTGRRYLVH
jgi:hypothetical protein